MREPMGTDRALREIQTVGLLNCKQQSQNSRITIRMNRSRSEATRIRASRRMVVASSQYTIRLNLSKFEASLPSARLSVSLSASGKPNSRVDQTNGHRGLTLAD